MADLYRKSSIERLSDSEQLDRMIKVSSPMSWLALVGIALVIAAVIVWAFMGTLPETVDGSGVIVSPENVCAEFSDCSGTVEKLYINAGADFSEGDKIAGIKTASGEIKTVSASSSGKAFLPLKKAGDTVFSGTEIARYTPDNAAAQTAVCYIPSAKAQRLKKGMRVLIYPMSTEKFGHLEATVRFVGEYPAETENMKFVLGSGNSAAEEFTQEGPVTAVVCELKTDSSTKSGYYWSNEKGKEQTLSNGTFVSAKIVIDEYAPITKLFNGIKERSEG